MFYRLTPLSGTFQPGNSESKRLVMDPVMVELGGKASMGHLVKLNCTLEMQGVD